MELFLDNVSKQYQNKTVVDRISLHLHPGIYGLLGENGAGKTTLLRMICGILKPSGGTIAFDEHDVSSEDYRAILGYLPQDFGYYPEFTGMKFLLYMATLKGLPKAQAKRKAKEVLELTNLQENAHKKIKTYSGGMKQRVGHCPGSAQYSQTSGPGRTHRRARSQRTGALPKYDQRNRQNQYCHSVHPCGFRY